MARAKAKTRKLSGWSVRHKNGLGYFTGKGRGRKAWHPDGHRAIRFQTQDDADTFNDWLNGNRPGKHHVEQPVVKEDPPPPPAKEPPKDAAPPKQD